MRTAETETDNRKLYVDKIEAGVTKITEDYYLSGYEQK